MSAQNGVVLNWSTRHEEKTVFEALTDAIASLEEVDRALLDEYRVIWETEDRNYDSTSYTITGFGTSVGETTLKIRGGRGGDYEIFPKNQTLPPGSSTLTPELGGKKNSQSSPSSLRTSSTSRRMAGGASSRMHSKYWKNHGHSWKLTLRLRLMLYCCSHLTSATRKRIRRIEYERWQANTALSGGR